MTQETQEPKGNQNNQISTHDFIKQIQTMQNENARMKAAMEYQQSAANRLYEIINELKAITMNIDPFRAVQPKRPSAYNYHIMKEDFYNMMKSGTYITRDIVLGSYPDMNQIQLTYVFKLLRMMPNVKTAKDGKTLRLYI